MSSIRNTSVVDMPVGPEHGQTLKVTVVEGNSNTVETQTLEVLSVFVLEEVFKELLTS